MSRQPHDPDAQKLEFAAPETSAIERMSTTPPSDSLSHRFDDFRDSIRHRLQEVDRNLQPYSDVLRETETVTRQLARSAEKGELNAEVKAQIVDHGLQAAGKAIADSHVLDSVGAVVKETAQRANAALEPFSGSLGQAEAITRKGAEIAEKAATESHLKDIAQLAIAADKIGITGPAKQAPVAAPEAKESWHYNLDSHRDQPGPRPRLENGEALESHHPQSQAKLSQSIANYSPKEHPTILLSKTEHDQISAAQREEFKTTDREAYAQRLATSEGMMLAHQKLVNAGVPEKTAGEAIMREDGYLKGTTPLSQVPETIRSAAERMSATPPSSSVDRVIPLASTQIAKPAVAERVQSPIAEPMKGL